MMMRTMAKLMTTRTDERPAAVGTRKDLRRSPLASDHALALGRRVVELSTK